jgi:hypothetical protein
LHQRLIYTGDETITDFAEAWAAIPDRAAGRRIPRSCIEPRWLRYEEAARYASYLERLFAAVGRDRVLVVVHDDLASDPAEQHRRILEFAGLAPMPPIDLGAKRVGYTVRYPWLQRLLKRPPKFLLPWLAGRQFKQRFAKSGTATSQATTKKPSLRKRVLRWNRVEDRHRPVPVAVQVEIREHFKGEVDRLGALLDRDLSHWLQVRSS